MIGSVRWFVFSLLAGCSFTPGPFSSSHDGDVPGDDGSGSSGDDSMMMQCTTHDLPPSVNVDATQWSAQFLTAPAWACDAAGI